MRADVLSALPRDDELPGIRGGTGSTQWNQSHGDLPRPRDNPRNPIIFYCDSTPTSIPALSTAEERRRTSAV